MTRQVNENARAEPPDWGGFGIEFMWMGDRPYQVDLCWCSIELAARALAYFCSLAVTLCWIRGVAELGTS